MNSYIANAPLIHCFCVISPLDLIGTFKNRWTFGFAFGAIANKVMSLFSEEYLPPGVPPWAKGRSFTEFSHFDLL